eukprot:Seg643.8 transcript_id=Seg643.8/GoldUCD/mRNA.D3Y31 product="Junction-mediating and -regulatory protein" protein_id=Seg643.8/GoldUCD/D3Y31
MNSPAIKDDWVAIKDFPLFPTGATISAKETPTEIIGQIATQPLSTENTPLPQESKDGITEVGPNPWTFRVSWINDLNVIQIKCSRRTENDAPTTTGETSNDFDANNNNNDDDEHRKGDQIAEYIAEISVAKLTSIHEQICLLCKSLDGTLPGLPTVPKGIWSYVSSVYIPESLQENMITYLERAKQVLGDKIFLETFFEQETVTEEEYLENLGDLNRKAFADVVKDAKSFLGEVLSLRDGSINIHDMVSLYSLEDEAQEKLDVAEAILFNFDRQPFLDMREVAHQELKQKNLELRKENNSEEYLTKLAEQCEDWTKQLVENESNLLDLQTEFFSNSLRYLLECRDRMIEDEMRFGKENFQHTSAWIRLREKLKDVASLSAQLLRLQRSKLVADRRNIRQELVDLEDNETLEKEIQRVEKKFFQKQIEIYDLDLKIVEEEEKLIRLKLKEFLTDGDSENEDDFFYEAFEEQPEDFQEQEIKLKKEGKEKSEEWKKKQQFVAKLNRLFRKRAWLRLRKRKCEGDRRNKISAKQMAEENYKWHHSIQMKRDKNKEELEEKKDFIHDMRNKTIDRLKEFKKKYPEPVVKRPPRYLPPVRRTRSGRSSPSPGQQSGTQKSSVSLKVLTKYEEAKRKNANSVKGVNKEKNMTGAASEKTNGTRTAENSSQASPPSVPPPPPGCLLPVPPPLAPIPPPPPLAPPLPLPTQNQKSIPALEVGKIINKTPRRAPKSSAKDNGSSKGRSDTFDLNDIISARRKLRKKTEDGEAEKVSSDTDDMMAMIRTGVKLRKVDQNMVEKENGLSDIAASMLRNTLAKMNKHMADSSDEEDNNQNDDFM